MTVTVLEAGLLEIQGLTAEQTGGRAAEYGYVLHELTAQQVTLEDAFIDITRDEVEFRAPPLEAEVA